jgi:uncharacterized Rmd1/YagE family protein
MSQLSSESSRQIAVRALLLGDRIDTAGLERRDVFSTSPLAFRIEGGAFLVLFRYGVAVLFGMSPLQEDEIIRSLNGRIIGRFVRREEELAQIEIAPEKDEQITPSGTITLKALLPEHVLIIADAIATNVILAHDERNVTEMHCSFSSAYRVSWRSPKSRMCFGSERTLSGFTLGLRTNMN